VADCFASRASRRRRRREQRYAEKIIAQQHNVARILRTQELSLFDNDYIYGSTQYKSAICGYMQETLFPDNFDRFISYSFSNEVRSAFANEYISTIYSKENFPLTYRTPDVTLDVANGEIVEYYSKYCLVHVDTSALAFAGFIALLLCFHIICCLLSYVINACLKFDFRNDQINMFW